MNVEPGVQIDLVGALKRRAALVASVAGAVFLAAYWVAMALPNEYTSYATMLVEPPSVNERLIESGVAERDLNTRLNLMSARILSRARLSRLIDEFGLYEEVSKDLTRAEIIDIMRGSIEIVPVAGALVPGGGKDTEAEINTFQIYFTYRGFAVPARVAQRLAQDFIDSHIEERVQVTQKSFEFIEQEQTRLATAIVKIEAEIADVKGQNTGSLPENLGSNQQQLLFTIGDLRDAEQQLAIAESDVSFWNTQNVSFAPGGSGQDVVSPARRLQILELGLAEYKARGYTKKHPDVIAATQEIVAIRESIEKADAASEKGERPMTFAQISVAAEQKRAELRSAAARDEIGRLKGGFQAIQARTAAIPRVAEKLDRLERQWRQKAKNLAEFDNRRLQAFVQAQLERRQLGEQFRILEAAFPPMGPSSPNRILILVIGAILGLVVGLGAGIALETIDSSVHAPRELQAALSIPVLAAVPAILYESDRIARFRKRLRYSLAAATVVVISLAGGAVSYVMVNGAPAFLQSEEESEVPAETPAEEEPSPDNAWRVPTDPASPLAAVDATRRTRG